MVNYVVGIIGSINNVDLIVNSQYGKITDSPNVVNVIENNDFIVNVNGNNKTVQTTL